MAPMLLTLEHELAFAPHALKAETLAASEPEAEDAMTISQCQICLDDVANDAVITAFCSESCSAVLCRGCLAEHVLIAVAAAFPGVLPKVRCPICLVQVNKAKWENIVSSDVVTQYKQACRTACSFQTPCCHNPSYTHLPYELDATDRPFKYIKPAELILDAPIEAQLEELHEQTRRFSNFEIASKDLVIFLEDTLGRHVDEATQLLILEHELPTILDEERRATLLLSYHAKYKVVTTRCCGTKTCFNCKRNMSSHANGDACDDGEISANCIIECRSCHVTMVKVEGCSAVQCWCGFAMDWDAELQTRDRYKKKLIPVDIFDIPTYTNWQSWQQTVSNFVKNELLPLRLALRLSRIDQMLGNIRGLRKTLRPLVQHKVWRMRFSHALPQLETELNERRLTLCTRRLSTVAPFVEGVRRAKWRACWSRVVKAIHMKQFWLGYASEHRDEERELRNDELAMLLPAFRVHIVY